MKDFSLIFLTCDKHHELWRGFEKLWKKYCPEKEDAVISTAETRKMDWGGSSVPALDVEPNSPWSYRLRLALEKTKTDLVLLAMDDFFLKSAVDVSFFRKCVQRISGDNHIKGIIFANNGKKGPLDRVLPEFEAIPRVSLYRLSCQIGLWKKDYLLHLLRDYESAWEFEVNASYRSAFHKGKVLQAVECPCVFDYDYGFLIIKGRYNPELAQYFAENENIDIRPYFPCFQSEELSPKKSRIQFFKRFLRSLFVR